MTSTHSTTLLVRLPHPHPGQATLRREARRFNVVACGRRFGKTVWGEDRLIDGALRGYPVAWFSPTYKMLAEVWRDVRRTLAPVTRGVSAQQHRIELVTGGLIDMWSLDSPDVARGRKYRRVIIDEAAMIPALGEAWQAVIRPTLADYQGDAWLLSTPKGRNFFATAFDWGQDPLQPEWMSWRLPTSANPYIAPAEIAAMAATMPERIYQQEIEAVFLADAGGVFRRVAEAATAEPLERAVAGRHYVWGVDWGKHSDFTAIVVLDQAGDMVALDRFNQIDYTLQLGRLDALRRRFPPALVVAERNSMGEPLVEQLQRAGWPVEPFTTTNASKAQVIDGLALAFEQAAIRILPDSVLVAELQAYEATRLPSGLLRYGAPEGLHDDTVMALALAWAAIGPPSGGTVVYDERVLVSPI